MLLAHINEAALEMLKDPVKGYKLETTAYFLGVMGKEDKEREYTRCVQELEEIFHGLEPTVVTLI